MFGSNAWFGLKEGKSVVISFTEVVFNKRIAGSGVEYIVCFLMFLLTGTLENHQVGEFFFQIKLRITLDHLEA